MNRRCRLADCDRRRFGWIAERTAHWDDPCGTGGPGSRGRLRPTARLKPPSGSRRPVDCVNRTLASRSAPCGRREPHQRPPIDNLWTASLWIAGIPQALRDRDSDHSPTEHARARVHRRRGDPKQASPARSGPAVSASSRTPRLLPRLDRRASSQARGRIRRARVFSRSRRRGCGSTVRETAGTARATAGTIDRRRNRADCTSRTPSRQGAHAIRKPTYSERASGARLLR